MTYRPIIYKLKEKHNPFEVFLAFIQNWYEIEINSNFCKWELPSVKMSENIKELVDLLIALNCTTITGKKRLAYNGFQYLFHNQNFLIRHDTDLNFLIFLQEGKQDFYYGIPIDKLQEENPMIYRIVKNSDKTFSFIEDNRLIEFITSYLCVRASKIGVKCYSIYLNKEVESNMEMFNTLFTHKTNFEKIIVLERENAIATIRKKENAADILTINKWEKNQKDFTKEIVDVFSYDGWSDNTARYKL